MHRRYLLNDFSIITGKSASVEWILRGGFGGQAAAEGQPRQGKKIEAVAPTLFGAVKLLVNNQTCDF